MRKNKKTIKLIIFIFIIVLLTIFGTLYERNENVRKYLDKYLFAKEKHENNLPTIELEQAKDAFVFGNKKNILVLQNNMLKTYNHYGNEEYSLDIHVSNPIFSSNGSYIAIGEKGGTNVYVISDNNILWKKELEDTILDIKINDNGYLIVATTGTVDKNTLEAYDNKGNKLFKYFISSSYIIDMDISSDNKYVAIAEANSSGILVKSNVKILSIDKIKDGEKTSVVYTSNSKEGELITNIKYQVSNVLSVIYDNHIETIKNFQSSSLDFSNEEVLFADLNDKIIKVTNKNPEIFLQIISTDLTSIKEYKIDEPKKIYVSANKIALNFGNKILFYSNSGWLVKEYYASQEINNIILSSELAGIVYSNKIELISL